MARADSTTSSVDLVGRVDSVDSVVGSVGSVGLAESLPRSAISLTKNASTGTSTAAKTAQKNTLDVAVAMPCTTADRIAAGIWASVVGPIDRPLPPLLLDSLPATAGPS